MLSETLKEDILFLRSEPHGSGVSISELDQVEEELRVKLPENYRDFLRIHGWGGIGHYEFFGIGESVPSFLNLLKVTRDERNLYKPAIPEHLVPILNDGAGNHYCLDTWQINIDDCPVVFWDHEQGENQIPEISAQSFHSWLTELILTLKNET